MAKENDMSRDDVKRDKGWKIQDKPKPSGDPGGVSSGDVLKFKEVSGSRTVNVSITGTQWNDVTWDFVSDTLVTGALKDGRGFSIVHDPVAKTLTCTIDPVVKPRRALSRLSWLEKLLEKLLRFLGMSDAGSWTAIEGG
jgi:hypothetical protein